MVGAGGLGHIGIQCLAAMTATTIVVVDRNPAAELAGKLGADHTVVADGSHVDAVLDLTDGQGAEVVLDFAAEQGAQQEGFAMTRRGGSQYIIGYGSNIDIPTIDIISTERNVVGNLVGTYNDLAELMVLAQAGKVTLHTKTYPLADAPKALADLDAGRVRGRSSSPDGRGQTRRSSSWTMMPSGSSNRQVRTSRPCARHSPGRRLARLHHEAHAVRLEPLRLRRQVSHPQGHVVDADLVEAEAVAAGWERRQHQERGVGVVGPAQLGHPPADGRRRVGVHRRRRQRTGPSLDLHTQLIAVEGQRAVHVPHAEGQMGHAPQIHGRTLLPLSRDGGRGSPAVTATSSSGTSKWTMCPASSTRCSTSANRPAGGRTRPGHRPVEAGTGPHFADVGRHQRSHARPPLTINVGQVTAAQDLEPLPVEYRCPFLHKRSHFHTSPPSGLGAVPTSASSAMRRSSRPAWASTRPLRATPASAIGASVGSGSATR